MIEIRHLRKEYPNDTPLQDVNTDIRDGDVIAVIGPSGTGKSTLLRCINLLETPTSGSIRINGEEILDWMIRSAREGHRLGRSDLGIGAAYAGYLAGAKGRRSLGLFFRELAACEDGAALWHCHTGKDRTGIAAGLILDVLGADWDAILCDYECSNLIYQHELEAMEQMLRRRGVEEEILPVLCGFEGVRAPMLENAWKYMKKEWGGAEGYLRDACGVAEEELEALRERYIEG